MKFDLIKTRRGKLKKQLEQFVDETQVERVLNIVDEYEKNNLETIDKLKRDKSVEINKINGALKQTINAHGPITKILIGSASKRIYGSLLADNNNKKSWFDKLKQWFKKLIQWKK